MKRLLLMMSCMLLLGCGNQSSVSTSKYVEPEVLLPGKEAKKDEVNNKIRIGVIAPLSGPGSSYGQDVVEVVNRFGKKFNVLHPQIQISWIVEDGGCNGKDATSAARKLIEVDQVVAIIGGVCSSETLAAGKIAQDAGVMMIAPGSASSKISEIGEYVVRTYNNTISSGILANVLDASYKHALVITEQKDYPQDMADRFVDAFDGEVTYIAYQSTDQDFKAIAKQAAQATDPDALFMFSQSEATSIPLALALDDEGLLEKYAGRTYGANNLLVTPFMDRLGELAEGMQEVNVATVSMDVDDVYLATLADYAIQGDGFTVLQAADAFRMITNVVLAQGGTSIESVDIKNYIYSYDQENPYVGYLGSYWFDEQGDAVNIGFDMYEVIDGERVVQQ